MRKLMTIILALTMLFSITACKKKCDHNYKSSVTKKATCAEKGVKTYTCSKCGDSYTEAIPKTDKHEYTSEITKKATVSETGIKTFTCSVCGDSYTETIEKVKSNWKTGTYVDEFGDSTDSNYIIGTFTGTFSNTATTKSDLTVFVYLEPTLDAIQFRLVEYGSNIAEFDSYDSATLKTKDSSGNVKEYDLIPYGDLYSLDVSLVQSVVTNEELSFVITEGSSTYWFSTDNLGLSDLLN